MNLPKKPLQAAIVGALALGLAGPGAMAQSNPCAGKKNPCAAKTGANPCAAKKPGGTAAGNPCAANPCAAKKK